MISLAEGWKVRSKHDEGFKPRSLIVIFISDIWAQPTGWLYNDIKASMTRHENYASFSLALLFLFL